MKKLRINRAGRPKKIKNIHDFGTPELIKKRINISPTDPTMASCPLDTMLAKGHIKPEAHAAASLYRAYHHRAFGSPHPHAVDLTTISGPDLTGDLHAAEWRYRDACSRLKAMSRHHFDAVENIVIHERWPHWMLNSSRHTRERARTIEGFGVLMLWESSIQRAA